MRTAWCACDKDLIFHNEPTNNNLHNKNHFTSTVTGIVGDCTLSAFGDVTTCQNHACDSNCLWTGTVVAAEAFRYAVTQTAAAKNATLFYFGALKLLNKITAIPGEGYCCYSPTPSQNLALLLNSYVVCGHLRNHLAVSE